VSYVHEILFMGQACIADATGSRCSPEPRVKHEIARLGRAVKAIDNLDILFVVGAGQGMAPYLRSIARAVAKLMEDTAQDGAPSVRYSAVLYGDYNRTVKDGLDYYAIPFSAISDPSGLTRFEALGTYQDENKDKPDAPFAALERAARTAQWSANAANRLIIWIGDHGNRPAGKYSTAAGELIETKTAQSVIDAIKGADSRLPVAPRTRFVAIQVQGGATASSRADFRRFTQDAEQIGRGLGEDVFKTIPARGNQPLNQERTALTNAILQQTSSIFEAIAYVRQTVGSSLGGEAPVRANLSAALLAKDVLTQLGYPPERLAEMGRWVQVVRSGFVFQNGRNPDFEYWLGFRPSEFAAVRQRATSLCENLQFSDRVASLEWTIADLARAATSGEMRPGETVREFYSRMFNVPANAISPLLSEGSPADFVRNWARWTSAQRDEKIAGICKKAYMLGLISIGQIVQERDLVFERNRVLLAPGAGTKNYDWRWIAPDGRTGWYFIPLDVLP
jgi:hypothetical protein